jgi:hypothetical protein
MAKRGRGGGKPRYKPPDETRRADSDAMIRQYGHPKPDRPVVWVEDVRDLMNGTEREYAKLLDQQILAGEVFEWRFEPCSFNLGHSCRYNPDFLVILADGRVEFHEVKGGRIEEDSLVKMKTFATVYGFFPLKLAQRTKKGFTITPIKRGKATWSRAIQRAAEVESYLEVEVIDEEIHCDEDDHE